MSQVNSLLKKYWALALANWAITIMSFVAPSTFNTVPPNQMPAFQQQFLWGAILVSFFGFMLIWLRPANNTILEKKP